MRRKAQLAGLTTLAAGLLALSPALASANTSVAPGSLTFGGSQTVGTTSAPKQVVVTVDCTTSIPIPVTTCVVPGIFQASPSTTGDFALSSNGCGGGFSANFPTPCVIAVTFKPKAEGLRTGTLTIGDNLVGSDPGTVSLTGAGVPAANTGGGTITKKKCKKKHPRGAQIAKKCKKK